MKITQNNGFLEITESNDGFIVSVGCDQYYPSGIKKETSVNSIKISNEILNELFESLIKNRSSEVGDGSELEPQMGE